MKNERLEKVLELSKALSSTLDLHVLLQRIDENAVNLTGAIAGSILLYDEDKKTLRFRSSSGEKGMIVQPLPVRDGIAWWVAQNGQIAMVNDIANDHRFTGNIDKVSGFITKNILCVPVILEDEIIGVIEVLNKADGTVFTNDDEWLLSILASQSAIAVKNAKLVAEQRNFFTHAFEILITAIEAIYQIPEGFYWEVARLSIAVGRKLGMEEDELQALYNAASFHDLGVLNLKLNGIEDGNLMRLHPALGAKMVKPIDILRNTESMIYHHHEYIDGSGYPDGLKGGEIPLGSRIIIVVEAFEKAISDGKSHSLASARIQKNSGKLFDPVVVDTFLSLIYDYEEGKLNYQADLVAIANAKE
jgi:response regulator RpfG family c-di-GMP phosphodiesterase